MDKTSFVKFIGKNVNIFYKKSFSNDILIASGKVDKIKIDYNYIVSKPTPHCGYFIILSNGDRVLIDLIIQVEEI